MHFNNYSKKKKSPKSCTVMLYSHSDTILLLMIQIHIVKGQKFPNWIWYWIFVIFDHHFALSISVSFHKRRELFKLFLKKAVIIALPLFFGAFCTQLVPKASKCMQVVPANAVISCRCMVALTWEVLFYKE